MSKLVDLTGQQFNNWTVLKYMGKYKWLCRCKCGREKLVLKNNLVQGLSRQCHGCAMIDVASAWRLPEGEAASNDLISRYKNGAKARNIPWGLTSDQVRSFFTQPCFYCGIPPQGIWYAAECNGGCVYNGIDRIDSSLGYTVDNCVACCTVCNYMKASHSFAQFKDHIGKIYRHLEEL